MREALYLVNKGVPFDVAFEVEPIVRGAWCIIFGEIESGRKYNFVTNQFEEAK